MKIKHLKNSTRLALATAFAVTPFTVSTTLAQPLALELVLVTAQRIEGSLQETPIAVTAFTADKIQDMGIFDVTDIGSIAPNTNIQKQPSSNSNMSIFIRGVGSGETSLLVDPKTSFYIDGIYMSKTVGGVFDLVDLERIEVLRGPQGTLFGRNSSGGAVNVTAAKPSGELYVRAGATVGNDGLQRYSATVDLPQIADMLSVRLNGSIMEYDGWADNSFTGGPVDVNGELFAVEQDLASEDNSAFRIALRFEPMDNLTLDYTYDNTDNTGVPAPFQITKVKDSLYNGFSTTPFPFEFLGGELFQQMAATVGDPNERRENYELDSVSEEFLKVEGHSFQVAWELENVTIKYTFGDRETESGYGATDLDGGNYFAPDLFYGDFTGTVTPGTPIAKPGFVASIDEGTIDMTTHELQFFGTAMDDRLQYTTGLYYYEEKVFQSNPQTFSLPITFLASTPSLGPLYQSFGYCDEDLNCQGSQRLPLPFPDPGADPNGNGYADFQYGQDAESWAIYTQVTFAVTDELDVTGGIRYTEDKKDAFLFNESLNHVSIDDKLTGDQDWDNISYLLRANYAVRDGMNVYGSVSTGYNSGGFNARAGSVPSWETIVDEETVTSYEIGLKSEWWDNRLRANFAVFYNDYKDIQLAVFEAGSGGASSRLVNAGAATYQGIELDLTALLAEGLTLDLTYGYLDAEFDEYLAVNPTTNLEEDISGISTVPRAPEHTASVNVNYEFQPFNFGVLSANVGATYTDSMVWHPFNNQFDSTDDRTLVQARVSLSEIGLGDSGALRISVWGKNLTDEEYREWGIDFGSLGFAGNVYGQPLSFGVDVVYEFR